MAKDGFQVLLQLCSGENGMTQAAQPTRREQGFVEGWRGRALRLCSAGRSHETALGGVTREHDKEDGCTILLPLGIDAKAEARRLPTNRGRESPLPMATRIVDGVASVLQL